MLTMYLANGAHHSISGVSNDTVTSPLKWSVLDNARNATTNWRSKPDLQINKSLMNTKKTHSSYPSVFPSVLKKSSSTDLYSPGGRSSTSCSDVTVESSGSSIRMKKKTFHYPVLAVTRRNITSERTTMKPPKDNKASSVKRRRARTAPDGMTYMSFIAKCGGETRPSESDTTKDFTLASTHHQRAKTCSPHINGATPRPLSLMDSSGARGRTAPLTPGELALKAQKEIYEQLKQSEDRRRELQNSRDPDRLSTRKIMKLLSTKTSSSSYNQNHRRKMKTATPYRMDWTTNSRRDRVSSGIASLPELGNKGSSLLFFGEEDGDGSLRNSTSAAYSSDRYLKMSASSKSTPNLTSFVVSANTRSNQNALSSDPPDNPRSRKISSHQNYQHKLNCVLSSASVPNNEPPNANKVSVENVVSSTKSLHRHGHGYKKYVIDDLPSVQPPPAATSPERQPLERVNHVRSSRMANDHLRDSTARVSSNSSSSFEAQEIQQISNVNKLGTLHISSVDDDDDDTRQKQTPPLPHLPSAASKVEDLPHQYSQDIAAESDECPSIRRRLSSLSDGNGTMSSDHDSNTVTSPSCSPSVSPCISSSSSTDGDGLVDKDDATSAVSSSQDTTQEGHRKKSTIQVFIPS